MARRSTSYPLKEEELDLAEELKKDDAATEPKRPRRSRTKKVQSDAIEAMSAAAETDVVQDTPKRTRRSPTEDKATPKKPRTRKKSTKTDLAEPVTTEGAKVAETVDGPEEPKPPEKPVKVAKSEPPIKAPDTAVSSQTTAVPTIPEVPQKSESHLEPTDQAGPVVARPASSEAVVALAPRLQPVARSEAPVPLSAASGPRQKDNRRPESAPRPPQGGNSRRDLPRQREAPLTMAQLDAMTLLDLYKLARQFNIDNFRQYKKGELIWEILRARTHKDGFVFVQGLLDVVGDYGFLRPTDFQRSREDVYVSASQIRRFDLRSGDQVSGQARPPKDGERYFALLRVEAVNGLSPEKSAERPDFDGLTPIFPDSRFRLETSREDLACRLVDIIAPIGRGQRGLIVAPPKAGKTVLLKKLANAISQNSPDTHLMVLLIDERPEEVTDMERSVHGEVASSTFDEPPEDHIRVAEMVLERAKRLVEMGKDVVILLDSITRLARAYNLTIPASGRTLSGGMDPAALHKPKRFFGAARRVEHGGSLTILATALVDTGSRMDDVIYEEFKGTGNMELHLDRKLAERRTFPAVDIKRSGTRREDLLMTAEELDIIWQVRKAIHNLGNQEATELLLQNLRRTRSNAEFFKLFMASQGSQG